MKRTGRRPAQRLMRAVFVVIDEPSIGDCLELLELGDQMCIEHFGAIRAIEALHKGVWLGLPGWDIANQNAFGRPIR